MHETTHHLATIVLGQSHAQRATVLFSQFLEQLSIEQLPYFIERYAIFNRPFAGRGLILAGRLYEQAELFGDIEAADIAGAVLRALVDEFLDGQKSESHRLLCTRFLSLFTGPDPPGDGILERHAALHRHVSEGVRQGYRLPPAANHLDVARALGFHYAVEMNGVVEFCVLDAYLKDRRPALFGNGAERPPAYKWVSLHTIVEDDHKEAARAAIALARPAGADRSLLAAFDAQVGSGIAQFYSFFSSFLDQCREARNAALPVGRD